MLTKNIERIEAAVMGEPGTSAGTVPFIQVRQVRQELRPSSTQKRAYILADTVLHPNREPGFRRHVKGRSGSVSLDALFAVELHFAGSIGDGHLFRRVGTEVILSGIDQTEGLFGLVREKDRVTDDFTVEIDICFRDGGNLRKLHD